MADSLARPLELLTGEGTVLLNGSRCGSVRYRVSVGALSDSDGGRVGTFEMLEPFAMPTFEGAGPAYTLRSEDGQEIGFRFLPGHCSSSRFRVEFDGFMTREDAADL